LSNFQVISPSARSTSKGHRNSAGNNSNSNDSLLSALDDSDHEVGIHKSLSAVLYPCTSEENTLIPSSKSAIDIRICSTSSDGNCASAVPKVSSVVNILPKTISQSIFKMPSSNIITENRSSDHNLDTILPVSSSINNDGTLESCPLLSSIPTQIVGNSSSYTSSDDIIIVHSSCDPGDQSTELEGINQSIRESKDDIQIV